MIQWVFAGRRPAFRIGAGLRALIRLEGGPLDVQLIDGLYAYVWQGEGNNCNTYALRYRDGKEDRFAVVDPGSLTVLSPCFDQDSGAVRAYQEPALEKRLRAMEQDGIRVEQIGLVINTHAHPDHCDSALALRRAGGARVALHRGDEKTYARLVARAYPDKAPAEEELRPDIYLEEGKLELGGPAGPAVQVLHTPGHSPGGVSLWWEANRVLLTGDTVFYRSVGRTDIPGGSDGALKDSVARLAALKADYLLTGHPYGHPGVISGSEEVARNFDFIVKRILPMF